MIIYPAVDIRMGQCVRLEQGDFQRGMQVAESPIQAARNWQKQGAERLHVVDLDGARAGYPCNLARIAEIAKVVSIPIQLGGGIRTEQHIDEALEAGVSRVVLGTRALQDPRWVARMVQRYPEKILAGIDARQGKVAVRGWYEDTEETVMAVAKRMVDAGVTEIIYTDISKDGMLQGPILSAWKNFWQQEFPSLPRVGCHRIRICTD